MVDTPTIENSQEKKRRPLLLMSTLVAVLLLVLGVIAGTQLVRRNQDLRRSAAGGSDCGQSPDCVKLDSGGNSGSYTSSRVIDYFIIKAGTDVFRFPGSTTDCYSVTLSDYTVRWQKTGPGPICLDVSHVEIWQVPGDTIPTPTPSPNNTPTPIPTPTSVPQCKLEGDECVESEVTRRCCTGLLCVPISQGSIVGLCTRPTATPPPPLSTTPTPSRIATVTPTSLPSQTPEPSRIATATPSPSPTLPPGVTVIPSPTPDFIAQCNGLFVYDQNWNLLSVDEWSTKRVGEVLRLATYATVNWGYVTKARFVINDVVYPETALKKPGSQMFYYDFTIPRGTNQFAIKAELFHSTQGWF